MLSFYKREIARAIRVLGPDQGEMQNVLDIKCWLGTGYITSDEADGLREYNRNLAKSLRDDEP